MSKMSMPYRGRTITTEVSGGRSGALAGVVLLLVALAAAYAVRDAVAPYVETVGTVLTATAVIVAVGAVLAVLAVLAPEVISRPGTARTEREYRRHCVEVEQKRTEIEAGRVVAATAAQEVLDHTKAAPTRSTDDTRDGRLIDAADRFRSLGTFLPDDSTGVDQEPADADRPSTTLDREA